MLVTPPAPDTAAPRAVRGRFAPSALAFLTLLLFSFASPGPAHASPHVRPWTPSDLDSLTAWAVRARTLFRQNTGDSLGGTNYIAYEFVGKIGRTLLRSLGRGNF